MNTTGHRARKRFGQHFLHDPGVVQRILAAVDAHPGERLLEIGPGLGALTGGLLAAATRLDAVELDRDLIPGLRARFGDAGLVLHEADALNFDFAALAADGQGPLRLVGNLPYNISSPLLFHLFGACGGILDMHFMLQKEFAERLCAAPGSRAYGRLSVMTAYHCSTAVLMRVPPGAFRPPPKVESAVVRLIPYRRPPVSLREPPALDRVVRQAFSMRRKTLRNSLRGLLPEQAIRLAGIDPELRPEVLDLAQFAALSDQLASI